ncbi:hypothetical protein B0H67DRAFT_353798 [Lasiosphaeris hirsuta]|uniref:NodB homology domain-containing protein n=1 Tax=Lasiosphaeris hirsuta TaxID=260670 RepID=A0AA39ZW05_9PEZI|nr:hypothetical protein B0H67DRAFT_353798 [Lasiosphaeris hirsuta]
MHIPKLLPIGALLAAREQTQTPAQASSSSPQPLLARDVPYGVIIEHCTVPGVVALTFDDGPFQYTSQVLDTLAQYGAKATFFVNGDNWSHGIDDSSTPWPATLKRMINEGHQIGSHTWSHVDLTAADSTTRYSQMHQLDVALTNVIGKSPTYMRPPYATCEGACLADMQQLGYHVINFDVDTKDYLHDSPEDISVAMDTFSAAVEAGGPSSSFLVLSHDVHEQTAVALTPYMLDKIYAKGYRAVTVGECLGDAPENWYRSS